MYGCEQIFIFVFITAVFDDNFSSPKLMIELHRLIHGISVCDDLFRADYGLLTMT